MGGKVEEDEVSVSAGRCLCFVFFYFEGGGLPGLMGSSGRGLYFALCN